MKAATSYFLFLVTFRHNRICGLAVAFKKFFFGGLPAFQKKSQNRGESWSIRLLSGHALTCQSPAKLALANTNNYTRKARAPSTDPYQYNYMCVVWG